MEANTETPQEGEITLVLYAFFRPSIDPGWKTLFVKNN
jgi:hypothetical protein